MLLVVVVLLLLGGRVLLGVEEGGGGLLSPAVEGGVLDVLLEPGEVGPGVGGPPPPG